MRLALVASHPIQYQVPIFRELAKSADLTVFFCHRAAPSDQAKAGFNVEFEWDRDLLSGYDLFFLKNIARRPGLDRFGGCDTPEIADRLRQGNFNAVIISGWHLKSFLQAFMSAKRCGIPILARGDSQLETPRSGLKRLAKRLIYPTFLSRFDAALYVGERSRKYWTHYGYAPERLFLSPHCVDTKWFSLRASPNARVNLRSELGVSSETKLLLFAGKLVDFKRPGDLISAAARLKREGQQVEVLVAGSGPLEASLSRMARKSGVPCHFLGFRNQTEIPAAYAAADLLVLPSDARETWGLVANEALASGVPIVVSDAAGCAPDLAEDGTAGRTFQSGDIEALAEAIEAILKKPPSAEAISAKSRSYSVATASDGIIRAADFASASHSI